MPTRTKLVTALPPDHVTLLISRAFDTLQVLALLLAIVVLAVRHDIRSADVTTLLGTMLGFAGRGAVQQIRARHTDESRP